MLANNLTLRQLSELRGRPVFARSGEYMGKLAAVLYDDESGRAGWIGIRKGPFRRRLRLAPAGGAALRESGIRLPYSVTLLDSAPAPKKGDPEGSRIALYRHYHLSYPGTAYPTAIPPEAGELPQEPLPKGAIWLRRWLESLEETKRVVVQREVLRIRRVPIYEPVEGVELGSQFAEITLMDEEPAVSKRVVARERISIEPAVQRAQGHVRATPPAAGEKRSTNGTGRDRHDTRQRA